MYQNVEELKSDRPNLVEEFEAMDREQLLKQCYLECVDANNMEERVSIFMAECTNNMSKTNYTLESLRTLINEQKEIDAKETIEDCIQEEIEKKLVLLNRDEYIKQLTNERDEARMLLSKSNIVLASYACKENKGKQ